MISDADAIARLSALGFLDEGARDGRAWSARHVGRNHRIRKPIGAERLLYAPPRGFKPMVVVKQFEPGYRSRALFGWRQGEPLLNAEAVAARMYGLASDGSIPIPERLVP